MGRTSEFLDCDEETGVPLLMPNHALSGGAAH
jgi:hypothetical protein